MESHSPVRKAASEMANTQNSSEPATASREDAVVYSTDDGSMHEYVVVMRAPSGVRFRREESVLVMSRIEEWGPITLRFATRYHDRGVGATLPGDLWVEIRGPAPSLREAARVFATTALYMTPVLAFVANAAVGALDAELIFDSTPGLREREYFQNYIAPESDVPDRRGRLINPRAAMTFIEAIGVMVATEHVHRAVTQYAIALDHWRFGHETLALAFLYMGVEALAQAVVEVRRKAGVSHEEFGASLGVKAPAVTGPSTCPRCAKRATEQWRYEFLAAIRREYIFQGDKETYRMAKSASDGFEHGYADFDQVRRFAREARDRTAAYLRTALVNLVPVDQSTSSVLLDDRFSKPIGPHPIVNYLWGTLIAASDELAEPGAAYPYLEWQHQVTSATVTEDGGTTFVFSPRLTAKFAPGVQFKPRSIEGWDPGGTL